MSVGFIIGKPGCGKSLVTLQSYILPALLQGRNVYHNVPGLDCVKIAWYLRNKYSRRDITPYGIDVLLHDYSLEYLSSNWKDVSGEAVVKKTVRHIDGRAVLVDECAAPTELEMGEHYLNAIPKAPSGSLVVLDEAQKKCYINSKDWQTEKNKKFFEYCSVHRKSKHEVLIITQDDSNVDSSVNGIREEMIFMLRQERLGWLFRNRVSLRYYLGHQTIHQKPYAKSSMVYDKAMYGLYDSYSANDGRTEVRRVRSVFRDWRIYVGVLVMFYFYNFGVPLPTKWLFSGGPFKAPGSGLLSSSAAVSSSSFSPSAFLGGFEDYHCSDKIYVLRVSGMVDTIPPRSAPAGLCPKFDFLWSEANK
jgi:zona occludens toxin (predicted ATPase)